MKMTEDNTMQKLNEMIIEDLNKPENKNIILNIGGIRLTNKDNPIKEEDYLFEGFTKLTNYLFIAENFILIQPIYYDDAKIFWIWNNNKFKWEIVDETDLLNLIDRNTKYPTTAGNVKYELLEALRRVGRKYRPEAHKPSWIQLNNKIIDLETSEEFEAKPNFFITNPLNLTLGYSEETPTIDKLFEEWVGQEHKQELYEILAFSMVPSYFIDRLFCLIGKGANGKSTYLNLLINFLGEDNLTSSNLYLLLTHNFEGSKLLNKLVCLIGETNFNMINNTDFLKKLTGKDMIRAEFKGKNCFDFRNYAKLIMATNSLPPTADKTDGFYRRWKIIEFPNQFKEEKDVLSLIPQQEYNNLALKCLNIAKRLWKERAFTNDGSFEDRRKRYEEKSNPLMTFIKENYEKDVNNDILFDDFKESFIEYLESRGFRTLSTIAISRQLKAEGFNIKLQTKNKVNCSYILGLKALELSELSELSNYQIDIPHEKTTRNKVNLINSLNSEAQKPLDLVTTEQKNEILVTTEINLTPILRALNEYGLLTKAGEFVCFNAGDLIKTQDFEEQDLKMLIKEGILCIQAKIS